jgi:cyanophycin synthetase
MQYHTTGAKTLGDYNVAVNEVRALRRHNLYAYRPVLSAVIDVGAYADRGSDQFPGFVERLVAWLPGLDQHECSLARPGGFVERLRRGTFLPHVAEHVCLELQGLMGFTVTFGRARNAGARTLYHVLVEYSEEQPARAALEAALRMTLAAMHGDAFDVAGEIETLRDIADDYKLGPSTGAIVDEARRREIPIIRLTPTRSLVQLGYGRHQKRISASETPLTSAIAVETCQEKPLTNCLLRAVGVPVPEGQTAGSADEAWSVAQELGLPVVIKPHAGNQGKGVGVNLNCEAQVRHAYSVAAEYDSTVLVERYIEGDDYRLLVVDGKMVAAARRDPPQVIGDGIHTVEQLVIEINKDPRRRSGHSSVLTQITLNEASDLALAQQDLTNKSVPRLGQVVRLRTNANLSTGGTATDVTDECHPRNAQLAGLAAQILNLDVAGIDLLCRDIRRPVTEQDGAIVEVNAAPGLRMHLAPAHGMPRRVGRPIIQMLYPPGASATIPIIAVTGTNGKTTVTRLIAHMFSAARKTVGMTCTDGIYIDNERIKSGDCSGPRSAEAVLLHPRVAVAVLETARGGILREGLGYDAVDVGVVTNISADHLGLRGVETIEDLARVKQVVIEAVHRRGTAVLNADDRLVAAMATATEAPVIYFSLHANSPVIMAHSAEDGRSVRLADGMIVLQTGTDKLDLIELEQVAFTGRGKIRFQVANALTAVAAAWGAGLNPAIIARALTTFRSDNSVVPGRFNVMQLNGVEVVLDYAHNQAAMAALTEAVASLDKRRTIMVMGLPGDRRDQDLIATGTATLQVADHYVLHDIVDLRGRRALEVPQLLKSALNLDGRCEIVAESNEAIRLGWQCAKPGDRLLIIADEVDSALQTLQSLARGVDDEDSCIARIMPAAIADSSNRKVDVHPYRGW